jgi:hypothetical protein
MRKKIYIGLCAFAVFFLSVSTLKAATHTYDWFWFLYEKDLSGVYPSTMITPFYLNSKKGTVEYTASLPPFIFSKYVSGYSLSRSWLLGLVGDVDYMHQGKFEDYDFGLVPFCLYGSAQGGKGKYLFIWPVGGTFKGKLTMDYISPWIFPGLALVYIFPPTSFYSLLMMLPVYVAASIVPVYTSYGRADYEAHAILWPLIQWGKSNTTDEFRFLPFYSHNTKKDYYDNKTYGLFVSYGKTFLPKGREEDTLMVFPLLARRWSNDGISGGSSLLWPFFSWGYSRKQGNFELNFPWPFFIYQKSQNPNIHKVVVFPFYGKLQYGKDTMTFISPLYISLRRDSDTFKSDDLIMAFIIWHFTRDYRKSPSPYYGTKWSYFKIWPFFRYETNDRGDVHFNALSILPFRDPAGYEKIYDPLWSLMEYHRDGDMQRFGLFMRTYYQCWNTSSFSVKVPLLVSYDSNMGKISRLTFLCSMFGYEKDVKGSYLRFFWYPARIGEGDASLADVKETETDDLCARDDFYRPEMDGQYRYISFSQAVY